MEGKEGKIRDINGIGNPVNSNRCHRWFEATIISVMHSLYVVLDGIEKIVPLCYIGLNMFSTCPCQPYCGNFDCQTEMVGHKRKIISIWIVIVSEQANE